MKLDKPAFPFAAPSNEHQEGMLLRDYFAAQALGGLLVGVVGVDDPDETTIAGFAYRIADAMMIEREKPGHG